MTRTILCVENDPVACEQLTGMLERLGYLVQPAASARQALQVLDHPGIDGVLLEYDLPDDSGANLRSHINRHWPEMPVLMFAGVGTQTPFMVRFFDAYMRDATVPNEDLLQDLTC
jgi:DNA-binding NtrC family response regulator